MSKTTSNRLRIITESDDELIDQFEYNWPQLDKYAHPVGVPAGGTLSDGELYDGLILSEPPSQGKLWMSRRDNTGTNVKNYLTFPWSIAAVSKTYNQIGKASNQGWEGGVITEDCVNSSGTDLEAALPKRIIIPETGLYSCTMDTHVVGDGNPRAMGAWWSWQGADIANSESVSRVGAYSTMKLYCCKQFILRKGDKLGFTVEIFNVAAIWSNRCWVTLITPITENV